MPIRDDVSKRLEEFEKHWNELCKERKAAEMSKNDAESWRLRFQEEKNTLMIPVTHFELEEFNQTVDRVEDKLEISILEARANFREKEKIRLKEAYGLLGVLILFILKIIGKL